LQTTIIHHIKEQHWMFSRSIFAAAVTAVLAYFAVPLAQRLLRILPSSSAPASNKSSQLLSSSPFRVGLVGAANIAKFAVLWPASRHPDVTVHAVAARNVQKAQAFANKHGIPVVHETYQQLIQDPSTNMIYIGVISELHFSLAKMALEHGKHVLLEKPAVFSADQARILAATSQRVNRTLLEGFHWRFHPAAIRVKDLLVNDNVVGDLQQIKLKASLFDPKHTWFQPEDGEKQRVKLFDRWCYLVDELHFYLGSDWTIQVDHVTMNPSQMHANLTATRSNQVVRISVDACKDKVEVPSWLVHMEGSKGTLRYDNALFPFVYHRIVKPNGEVEQHYSFQDDHGKDTIGKTTYEYQLDEFVRIVQQEQHNYNHHQAVAEETQALLDSMIRNSELAEAIITASRQEPLRAWPYPPSSSSL
jgi:predicted dehydrogenase